MVPNPISFEDTDVFFTPKSTRRSAGYVENFVLDSEVTKLRRALKCSERLIECAVLDMVLIIICGTRPDVHHSSPRTFPLASLGFENVGGS